LEGDRDTTSFHRSASKHKKRNTIRKLINNDNEEFNDEKELERQTTSYFQDLYNSPIIFITPKTT